MWTRCVTISHFSPYSRKFIVALLLSLTTLSSLTTLRAQSESAAIDPRVEKLYTEAKAAEARGDLDGAVAKYESILQIQPRLGAAYNNLGSLYLKRHEYPKAAAVLEKGLKVDPAMPSASALLGMSLFEMAQYAEARPRLEAALRANPDDDNAELLLANDLIKLGEFEAAEGHLLRLSKRQPRNQEAWYLLGKVYMQLSERAFAKLDAIDPDSVLSHEIRGDVMSVMNNFPGALLEYKKAVELAPHQPGTHYKLGDAYWVWSDWAAAAREFQAELSNDPSNCMAQWKLGNILLEQHANPEEALSDIDKALAICPNLTEGRVDRGRALIRLNREADAIKDLQAAEQSSPNESTIHFLLAQAYGKTGRAQEAQSEMQLFSKLEESARTAKAERGERLLLELKPDK
jgi:tetratricopeptide (TPR) repeat protein